MTTFNQGDRVKVTITEVVEGEIDSDLEIYCTTAGYVDVNNPPEHVTVELIKIADDPSKGCPGTIRSLGGKSYVLSAPGTGLAYSDLLWLNLATGGTCDHCTLAGSKVVGVVPGSPADEARELWTGDGSDEPPVGVDKVRRSNGAIVERTPGGWWCTETPSGRNYGLPTDGSGWAWHPMDKDVFTEVRD